jgi:hypothetical protein
MGMLLPGTKKIENTFQRFSVLVSAGILLFFTSLIIKPQNTELTLLVEKGLLIKQKGHWNKIIISLLFESQST